MSGHKRHISDAIHFFGVFPTGHENFFYRDVAYEGHFLGHSDGHAWVRMLHLRLRNLKCTNTHLSFFTTDTMQVRELGCMFILTTA